MFSTICLLFLGGFILWMNTSMRIAWPDKNPVMAGMATRPVSSRFAAGVLFLAAILLCIALLGLSSGLFAAIVILMTAGSVAVLFFPFRYFGPKGIALFYCCALALELLIR